MNKKLIEELAELSHEQWAGWMVYIFTRCISNRDKSMTIRSDDVARWYRQLNTEYKDLSSDEKESDRVEALKMIDVVVRYIRG